MNYQRIYDQFINDRRAKESALRSSGDYFEKHHVVPKSRGGKDDPCNVICLSAQDHFFAHLLLAHIHGGKQWQGVFAMSHLWVSKNRASKLVAIRSRRFIALSREKTAEVNRKRVTGSKNPARGVHGTIYHIDGRSVSGYCTTIAAEVGLAISTVYNLLTKKTGMTNDGWFAFEEIASLRTQGKINSGEAHANNVAGKNARRIVCAETGQVFANRDEAARFANLTQGRNITSVCMGKRQTAGGYHWAYA